MPNSGEAISSYSTVHETTHSKNNCRRSSRLLDNTKMSSLCSVDGLFLDGEYTENKRRISRETAQFPPGKDSKNNNIPDEYNYGYPSTEMTKKPVGIIKVGCSSGEGENINLKGVTCVSHGYISVIGRRRAMEDAVTIQPGIEVGEFDVYDFFAVYDGHGGARVANACKIRMHRLVANEVGKKERLRDEGKEMSYWVKVMTKSFRKMDDEVTAGSSGGEREDVQGGEEVDLLSEKTVGSTAVVVMVGKEELVVANCGDSRAVLCREGGVVSLSNDHKPDRLDERQRVEAAGGKVIDWNGSRVLGVLGTSRSIGDQYLKPYVTSEPEVAVIKRTELDHFIVIGTDGLWDVISNEFACEVVKKCFDGQIKHTRFSDEYGGSVAAETAAILAELAMAKGSRDNISVIVVELKGSK